MSKQIVLHYAGSYVERPHTITFDSEREYEKFIQEKGYRLKPNVEYGVFTLNAVLRTQFQQSSINIEDVSEANKPDISTVTPPTLDIKYPQSENSGDDEVIVVGGEDENQDNTTQDSNPTTPPADNQEGNQEEEDVVVIGGDDDTQNPTEGTDTDVADTTDTTTDTTDTDTTDETQNENQALGEGFDRVSEVVSFGDEVTGNDGEESQTENTQDSGDNEIIIPDEGSSESTSPTPGDEDIIVL